MFLWLYLQANLCNVKGIQNSHVYQRFSPHWVTLTFVTVSWHWQGVLHSPKEVNGGASGITTGLTLGLLCWLPASLIFYQDPLSKPVTLLQGSAPLLSAAPWCAIFVLHMFNFATCDNLKSITMSVPTEIHRTHQDVIDEQTLGEKSSATGAFLELLGPFFLEGKPTSFP